MLALTANGFNIISESQNDPLRWIAMYDKKTEGQSKLLPIINPITTPNTQCTCMLLSFPGLCSVENIQSHLSCVPRDLWWTSNLEIEPTALNVRAKHSTTELPPQPQVTVFS